MDALRRVCGFRCWCFFCWCDAVLILLLFVRGFVSGVFVLLGTSPTAKKHPLPHQQQKKHHLAPTAKENTHAHQQQRTKHQQQKNAAGAGMVFSTVSAGRCFVFAVWARTGRSLTCWFAGASAAEHNGKKTPTAQKPKRLFWKPSLVRHCLLCYSSGCVPCFKVFVQLAEWKRKSQVSSLAHGSQNNARIS